MSNKFNKNENYYLFVQYMLYIQWMELLNYAHIKYVHIIGYLPIYPDFESSEVVFNSEYYQLNDKKKLDFVSGAPGDYFNSDGQKWGHPLYRFDEMKENSYKYFIDRYLHFSRLFDIVRIDYFKAFEKYFKIPIDGIAKDGFYENGSSYEYFDELFKYTDSSKFIVENLGNINDETINLRNKYRFKGMKIIQYTIDPFKGVDTLKSDNMVVYTGNHDNNTIVGWFNKISSIQKANVNNVLDKCNIPYDKIHNRFIKYVLKTSAENDYVIIPVQDILGLDESGRIKLPGIVDNSNWSWRLKNFKEFSEKISIMDV